VVKLAKRLNNRTFGGAALVSAGVYDRGREQASYIAQTNTQRPEPANETESRYSASRLAGERFLATPAFSLLDSVPCTEFNIAISPITDKTNQYDWANET